jgi:hypothetical protein
MGALQAMQGESTPDGIAPASSVSPRLDPRPSARGDCQA